MVRERELILYSMLQLWWNSTSRINIYLRSNYLIMAITSLRRQCQLLQMDFRNEKRRKQATRRRIIVAIFRNRAARETVRRYLGSDMSSRMRPSRFYDSVIEVLKTD